MRFTCPAGSVRAPLLAIFLVLALPAMSPAAAAPGPLSSLRSALSGLADPQKQAATDLLDAAEADRARAGELSAEREALLAEAAAAPAKLERLNAERQVDRAASLAQWQARLPAQASVETLEGLLETERAAAAQLRDRIAALTVELTRTISAPGDDTAVAGERQRRIEALSAPVPATADEPPAVAAARRARVEAELAKLQAEAALESTRRELAGTRQRLQERELRVLRHQLAGHEPRQDLLQQRIADLGRQELRALVASLEPPAEAVASALFAETARGNLRLGQEMLQVNEALADDRRALAVQDTALQRDLAALRDSRTRLELGGRSEQIGIWLWAELRRLEPERRLGQRLDDIRQELASLRLRLIDLGETQRDLADIGEAAEDLRAAASSAREEDAVVEADTADPLETLLERRVELAQRLEPLLWRRIATLEQAERSVQARVDATRELRQTLDRHLLWIRSHPRVDGEWLALLPEGAADLVKPSRLTTTVRLLRESIAESPTLLAGGIVLLVVLLVLRRRAPARLEQLAQAIRDVRLDRYRRTLESLAWTTLAALPGPFALLLLGRLLQGVGTSGKYSDSLGRAVVAVAVPMFTLTFLAWLSRERGLAHAHFRWTRPRREALRRWLPLLTVVLLPLYFLVALAFFRNQDLAISVQARIALVLSSSVFAAAFWWLLAPDRIWHSRGAAEPQPLRRAARVLLAAAGVAGALLALDGYVYSTAILQNSLLASVGVVTAVAVVHGLLSRWFVLGERRLALRRYLLRREAEAGGVVPEDGGEAIPQELSEEITLEKVNANSRALLRALKLVLLVLGLASVWAGVLPAFARFDEIALWTVSDVGADGATLTEQITLWSVMLGTVVLALTVIAARNLPGLIEIGLLSRAGVDAASRYAITSVSRYAIVLVGVIVGLGLFGLRWSQLQWMAAALTVGLGFGLQEIFANFVSGLILLFERPFRVGDTITVNGLDGTVTRIRTRATTILDFDNKEIVVPNKAFITGQLVNWTLSEEVTRVIIKVGVDYGADPALVHRLLMQAAEENPRVLKDRPMRSWLLNFGDNALDFELRVFVGTMADRLAARDELNSRVVELFHENGIGFAYPQLDVHIRDLPAPAEPSPVVKDGPR